MLFLVFIFLRLFSGSLSIFFTLLYRFFFVLPWPIFLHIQGLLFFFRLEVLFILVKLFCLFGFVLFRRDCVGLIVLAGLKLVLIVLLLLVIIVVLFLLLVLYLFYGWFLLLCVVFVVCVLSHRCWWWLFLLFVMLFMCLIVIYLIVMCLIFMCLIVLLFARFAVLHSLLALLSDFPLCLLKPNLGPTQLLLQLLVLQLYILHLFILLIFLLLLTLCSQSHPDHSLTLIRIGTHRSC